MTLQTITKKMENYIIRYGNENHLKVKNYCIRKWLTIVIKLSKEKV